MKIIGRFYFKQSENGNLLGEFSNNAMENIATESANIVSEFDKCFEGDFKTCWIENEKSYLLDLSIVKNGSIYNLVWSKKGDSVFSGQGFLVDKILIGDYRNFKIQ